VQRWQPDCDQTPLTGSQNILRPEEGEPRLLPGRLAHLAEFTRRERTCKSCPGQPTIARHLAPIRLSNDWRGDCHARSLSATYGDGQGATIWVGCAYDSDDALGIQTDPEERFVTIAAPGPHLTDLLVSATITTFNWLVVQNYYAMTPDLSQGPFTPHLWQAHKEGDQWRWEDPFVVVVSSGP
jgi:hypothetical protein